jgi:hypothetical protein
MKKIINLTLILAVIGASTALLSGCEKSSTTIITHKVNGVVLECISPTHTQLSCNWEKHNKLIEEQKNKQQSSVINH